MNINDKHPDYVSFIKNERKTLTFIRDNPYVAGTFSGLTIAADICLSKFPKDRFLSQMHYDFGAEFTVEVERQTRTVLIETILRPGFSQLSYVLSMCEQSQAPHSLMRKFHFDYASPHVLTNDPKPIYHIQYGGETTPKIDELRLNLAAFFPWLSVPRISHCPLNLALILDTVFCEFQCEATTRLIETDEWRKLVKENEDLMLVGYYKNLSTFLNSGHSSNRLIRDFCYGG